MHFLFPVLPSSYRWIADYSTDFLQTFKLIKPGEMVNVLETEFGPRLEFPQPHSDWFTFTVEDYLSNFCRKMGLLWKATDRGTYVVTYDITPNALEHAAVIAGENATVGHFRQTLLLWLRADFAEKVEKTPFVSVLQQMEINDYQ